MRALRQSERLGPAVGQRRVEREEAYYVREGEAGGSERVLLFDTRRIVSVITVMCASR